MKIVYCIAGTYRSGGMERVLANKANYLATHGYDIVIVTTDQKGREPFFKLDSKIKCYDLNINYEENNGKSIFNKIINYPKKQFLHKKRLTTLLKSEKPDITISMFCNDVTFITDINDVSKKILEIHFSKFKRLQYGRKGLWALADKWRTKQDEKLVQKFDKFIVLTKEDASYWGDLKNMQVIYNASPFKTELISSLGNKKVIAIGRYTHQKGFDMLLESWQQVNKLLPDWKLNIIGDGESNEIAQLKLLIKKYNISDSVALVRPTSNIEREYLSSSLLVLSSRYEGLPMILIEAQTFGLPIVAFDCKCGPKDVITNGIDGIIVNSNNTNEFAQAIIKLLSNKELLHYMSINAKESSKRFNEDFIMNQWITLFAEIYENDRNICS